jgi:pyruvate/2-oxoglutarate dehydrogenase complex dihydrolipoamide dehydrogenase (E3) component
LSETLVIGAGPAGVFAALRAADLGSKTTLLTSGRFGGMAAHDGPVPVRALAHAARLARDARQLSRYGVTVTGEASLDYERLLVRVREIVDEVGRQSALRRQLESAGGKIVEQAGPARFIEPHAVATADGRRYAADRIILCLGGVSRGLAVPGGDLVASPSAAWSLDAPPNSMLVIGAGATGVQVASVFNALGSRVALFQRGGRIVPTEEPEVSACLAAAFREDGVEVHEDFGDIESFERTAAGGVRMTYLRQGTRRTAEAELAVAAVGWAADTSGLDLAVAGVETNPRGFVAVDGFLKTSADHVYAAGDVTGGLMLAPQAMHAGFVAATNAVRGPSLAAGAPVNPIGSFTDPEYAQVGLSEAAAQARGPVDVVTAGFDETTRAIIDGRTRGFCKLIVDRRNGAILGCHLIGERAVEIAQIAAVAIAAEMSVERFAQIPLSFPTYAGVLGRAAAIASRNLNADNLAGITVG